MSYVNILEVVQNDYGYDLEFQITDAMGARVDLTGATVNLYIAEVGASSAKVSATCTITNPTQGECKYTVREGDFDEAPKVYNVQLEIIRLNSCVTATGVRIKVAKELPEA